MTKRRVSGVLVAFVLITAAWIYLFHDYISGNRWGWVKYKLGTFDSASVILGKEGLLFTKGSQDDIDDYRGLANPGNKLDRLKEVLTKRNDLVRSLGGRFLDVIPPISETTYNEFLPREYRKVGNRRRATLAIEAVGLRCFTWHRLLRKRRIARGSFTSMNRIGTGLARTWAARP